MKDAGQRILEVVVLGVEPGDEYALVETTGGTQEQFVVSRAVAGEHWAGLRMGMHVRIVVTPGSLGRVLAVSSLPAGRTGVP